MILDTDISSAYNVHTFRIGKEMNSPEILFELTENSTYGGEHTYDITGIYRQMIAGLFLGKSFYPLNSLIENTKTEWKMPSGHINSVWEITENVNGIDNPVVTYSIEKPPKHKNCRQLFNCGNHWSIDCPWVNETVHIVKLEVTRVHYSLDEALHLDSTVLFSDTYNESEAQAICKLLNVNKRPGDQIYIPVYRFKSDSGE